ATPSPARCGPGISDRGRRTACHRHPGANRPGQEDGRRRSRREYPPPGSAPSPAAYHLDTPPPAEPAVSPAPGGEIPPTLPDTPPARSPDRSQRPPAIWPISRFPGHTSPRPPPPAAVVSLCPFPALPPLPTASPPIVPYAG